MFVSPISLAKELTPTNRAQPLATLLTGQRERNLGLPEAARRALRDCTPNLRKESNPKYRLQGPHGTTARTLFEVVIGAWHKDARRPPPVEREERACSGTWPTRSSWR